MALEELRLHAHHEVEELLALNHLRGGLATHRRPDHRFHVRHIDAVAGDLVAIHVDEQARLAQLAHHRQLGKARNVPQRVLDAQRQILQRLEVRAEDFHRQRALQAGEGLIHGVFGGLCVIENDARKGREPFVD